MIYVFSGVLFSSSIFNEQELIKSYKSYKVVQELYVKNNFKAKVSRIRQNTKKKWEYRQTFNPLAIWNLSKQFWKEMFVSNMNKIREERFLYRATNTYLHIQTRALIKLFKKCFWIGAYVTLCGSGSYYADDISNSISYANSLQLNPFECGPFITKSSQTLGLPDANAYLAMDVVSALGVVLNTLFYLCTYD